MIHDKTLLFSADTTVKTATLTEPLSAFERVAIVTQPNTIRETSVTSNCNRRIDTIGSYTTDGYMIWPTNVVVGNNTTTLDVNHFQLLMQQGTSTATRTFGFNNTASNCNRILEVWGIDRKDGVTREGAGSPGSAYTAYNETLLCSGNAIDMTGDIQLAERANAFQRLKVGVGVYGENVNIYDVDAPTTYTSWMPLYSYWGSNTGSYYFSEHRYKFSNSATVLTPISGKTHQLGTAAANPYSTTGNNTSTETYIRHPLFAVWGINKKPARKLTILPAQHGSTTANLQSGYEYDIAELSSTPDEDWYLSGYDVTGATLTGNKFVFSDEDVTAQAVYTDQGYPITYESDEHVSLTGADIYIPGSTGITLQTGYDTYYRISGYEVTGGTVENGVLYPTGPCTVKAVATLNTFTASGGFEKGSNVHCESVGSVTNNANVGAKYATHNAHTGDIPASWYSTSNRWKPVDASAYTIRLMPKMTFTLKADKTSDYARVTACSLIGSTQTQTAAYSKNAGNQTSTYSKDFTSTTQDVNYGISAKLQTTAHRGTTSMGKWVNFCASADYIATGTTGTWSATGYAP